MRSEMIPFKDNAERNRVDKIVCCPLKQVVETKGKKKLIFVHFSSHLPHTSHASTTANTLSCIFFFIPNIVILHNSPSIFFISITMYSRRSRTKQRLYDLILCCSPSHCKESYHMSCWWSRLFPFQARCSFRNDVFHRLWWSCIEGASFFSSLTFLTLLFFLSSSLKASCGTGIQRD